MPKTPMTFLSALNAGLMIIWAFGVMVNLGGELHTVENLACVLIFIVGPSDLDGIAGNVGNDQPVEIGDVTPTQTNPDRVFVFAKHVPENHPAGDHVLEHGSRLVGITVVQEQQLIADFLLTGLGEPPVIGDAQLFAVVDVPEGDVNSRLRRTGPPPWAAGSRAPTPARPP
jgi:hypothetical protein